MWQGFWGTGYFNEDKEKAPVNVLRSVESKKLLSTAGRFKLLSSLDKAGLNLAKVTLPSAVPVLTAAASQDARWLYQGARWIERITIRQK